jgi:hypothetical protein
MPTQKAKLIEAFGEAKTVSDWARDPRCRVSVGSLWPRLREGWTMERAMTVLLLEERRVEAFGERKLIMEWAEDARCAVSRETLRRRLKNGEPAEQALTRPARIPHVYAPRDERTWAAFGELKTIAQWARDPRCKVECKALRRRLNAGVEPEAALSSPRSLPRRVCSAFGETKELGAWAKDARAAVSYGTVHARLEMGWGFEEALTTPSKLPGPRPDRARRNGSGKALLVPGGSATPVEAFGEQKTLREWAADRRCVVNYLLLRNRLNRGWQVERAIAELPPVGNRNVEAFGEWKSLYAWQQDPRCLVSHVTLQRRMDQGESLEEAMTRPPENRPRPRRRRFFDSEPSLG